MQCKRAREKWERQESAALAIVLENSQSMKLCQETMRRIEQKRKLLLITETCYGDRFFKESLSFANNRLDPSPVIHLGIFFNIQKFE